MKHLFLTKGTFIELSDAEVKYGTSVGENRRSESIANGFKERNGAQYQSREYQERINVEGALAELAFAKMVNVEWLAPVNVTKGVADVQPDWQVRWRSTNKASLIVRPDDQDNFRYVLMTGDAPTLFFRGWIFGRDAKQIKWFDDRNNWGTPVFWVPQAELKNIAPVPFQ